MADNQQSPDAGDGSKRTETKAERVERKAEDHERGEVANATEIYTGKIKAEKKEQKVSGNSKATGAGADRRGKGGLASAKDLLGDFAHETLTKDVERKNISPERQAELMSQIEHDGYIVGKPKEVQAPKRSAEDTGTVIDYKHRKNNDHSFSLGMNYQAGLSDQRGLGEKLSDFAAAAARRATDPTGWETWFKGEVEKIGGIAEGLNEAKEETKTAVAVGLRALTDGTVINFLAKPNAINEPLFISVATVFDAVSTNPNATNKALEALGNAVIKSSQDYSAMSEHDQGKVIGKVAFGMVNPEGSTEGAEVALRIADRVATQVDRVVMDTITVSVKAAERAAQQSPELAQQAEQRLLDYLHSKGLTGPQPEYAGVPKEYFEGMKPTRSAAKDNYMAMGASDHQGGMPQRRPEYVIENHPLSEKFFAELKELTENLSEGQLKFLRQNNLEIKPVRRVSDVFTFSDDRAACFAASENAIYIAQDVKWFGRWQPAENLNFDFNHELGHAINLNKMNPLDGPLCETAEFRAAFSKDMNKMDPLLFEELRIPSHTKFAARDEVFSDLYAHLTGAKTTNARSHKILEHFRNCFEHLQQQKDKLP